MSRTVLITGGSKGIGLACAHRFAALGDNVVVTYNTTPPPEGFASVRCDVTSVADVDAAFAFAEERYGPVEVLVSNAGLTNDGLLYLNSSTKFRDIKDGSTNTLLIGEKRNVRGDKLNWLSGTRTTLRNAGLQPNALFKDPSRNDNDPQEFADLKYVGGYSSSHVGGAQFVLGDGSVRFVSDNINSEVFQHLGSRADGALIGDF